MFKIRKYIMLLSLLEVYTAIQILVVGQCLQCWVEKEDAELQVYNRVAVPNKHD